MNSDDEAAALAHQQELESQQWQEWLAEDKDYLIWLDSLTVQMNNEEGRWKVLYRSEE
jgi:hypothetical protein